MKFNKISFVLLVTLGLLSSCSPNSSTNSISQDSISNDSSISNSTNSENSKTSTSDSSEPTEIIGVKYNFSSISNLVYNLLSEENNVNEEVLKETSYSSLTSKTVLEKKLTMYKDSSSSVTGSIKKYENEEVKLEDTLKSRTLVRKDKVSNNSNSYNEYNFLYYVTDFAKENFNNYHDEANKLFVVSNDSEATDLGLDDTQYILSTDTRLAATFQSVNNLYTFISANLINNTYVQQIGGYFIEENLNDSYKYTSSVKYSYPADLGDTVEMTYNISFTTDKDKLKLLNFKTEAIMKDYREGEENDAYYNNEVTEVTLTYGEDVDLPNQGLLNVDDYFVSNINDIEFYYDANKEDLADPNAFHKNSYYIFAFPKNYSPSTALTDRYSLIPQSSTNENVFKLDSSGELFELVGSGTTDLTYSYFGKNENGIYEEMTITKTITVLNEDPATGITILTSSLFRTDYESPYQVKVGQTYTLNVSVSPSSANQEFEVSTSDPTILEVGINNSNQLTIKALKDGNATITVNCKNKKDIKSTISLVSYTSLTKDETIKYLKGNSFKYSGTYYDATIKFIDEQNASITSNNSTYTFSYSINENAEIVTFDWSQTDEDGNNPFYLDSKGFIDANKNVVFHRSVHFDYQSYVLVK